MEEDDHAPYAALYLDHVAANDPLQVKVEYNGRHFDDEHALKLAEALKNNTCVKQLIFKSNVVTDEGLQHLCKTLETNTTVTELDLEGNQLTNVGCLALLKCLKDHNHFLTTVNLTDNAITSDLLEAVEDVCQLNQHPMALKKAVLQLRSNCVRDLDLSGTEDPKPYTMASTQALVKALAENTTLWVLDFSNNNIGDERTAALAEVFHLNHCLRELRLRNNEITCAGAAAMSAALVNNSGLRELDLRDNKISDYGAESFTRCLKTNDCLCHMDLRINNVSTDCLERLVHALMVNAQPRDLKQLLPQVQANHPAVRCLNYGDLPWDAPAKVNDTSCRVLLMALRFNTFVDTVDLSNNCIRNEGAILLADLLNLNKTITSINLKNNEIGDEGGEALLKALQGSSSVLKMDVVGNPMSTQLIKNIMQAVELNSQPWILKAKSPLLISDDPSVTLFEFHQATDCTDQSIQLFLELTENNTHLRELNLAQCPNVTLNGFIHLAQALSGNLLRGLTSLDVSCNSLGNAGAAHFATMLQTNGSLLQLLFQDNQVTAARQFVTVLTHNNHQLTSLDLSGNSVDPVELRDIDLLTRLNAQPHSFKVAILDLYANAPTLKELNLCEYAACGQSQYRYGKRFNDSSVLLLCEALQRNTVLTSLNLQGNEVTDKGAGHLADMITQNHTLTTLNLNYNKIGDPGFLHIARALYENTALTMVSCEGNAIHPDTRRKLNYATHGPKMNGTGPKIYNSLPTMSPGELDTQRLLDDQILADALADSRFAASCSTKRFLEDIGNFPSGSLPQAL